MKNLEMALKKEELTELERQWVEEAYEDETGYIDNTEVNMPASVERGVISSLIKKGIIEVEHDDFRSKAFGIDSDFFAAKGYEGWF